MIWVLVNKLNQIVNIIEYDGEQPYTPAKGLRLVQTDDEKQIGDTVET